MKFFFDTSALIKNYIEETGSTTVSDILASASAVYVSELTIIECFSTVKRLLVEKRITGDEYEVLKNEIRHDFRFFTRIDIEEAVPSCEELIDVHQLKTLDSIQLASSLCVQTEIQHFVCCDTKLLEAARKEQLPTINPSE